MEFDIKKYLTGKEKIVYKNQFVYISEEPGTTESLIRVYFEPSMHVFPISDNKKVWLIKEIRPTEKRAKWTLPGGSIENSQTPEQCAQVELHEELGYKTNELELFCKMPYLNKANNEMRYYFLARNLVYEPIPNPDGDVVLDKKEFSIQELKDMVIQGKFDWSPIAFAILKLARAIEDGDTIL